MSGASSIAPGRNGPLAWSVSGSADLTRGNRRCMNIVCNSVVVWSCLLCVIVSAVDDRTVDAPTAIWYVGVLVVPLAWLWACKQWACKACRPPGDEIAKRNAQNLDEEVTVRKRSIHCLGSTDRWPVGLTGGPNIGLLGKTLHRASGGGSRL